MKNPNHDYESSMKNFQPSTFTEVHERAIDRSVTNMVKVIDSTDMQNHIIGKARAKRAFGREKYGELSFQSSLINTLSCPTLEHLKDELVDAINYVAQLYYQEGITGDLFKSPNRNDKIIMLMESISLVLEDVCELEGEARQ